MNRRLALGDAFKKNVAEKEKKISEDKIKSFAKTGSFELKEQAENKPKDLSSKRTASKSKKKPKVIEAENQEEAHLYGIRKSDEWVN